MTDEKIFTIPLRKAANKAPVYKRTSRVIKEVKDFIRKKAKVADFKIGNQLNHHLWKRGIRNPFPRVKVKVFKEKQKDKELTRVELASYVVERPKDAKKKVKKPEKQEKKESSQ